MSNQFSRTAFFSWMLAVPAIVAAIVVKLMDIGVGEGHLLPFIAICLVVVLFVAALVIGLFTRTTIPSMLGVFTGLIVVAIGGGMML